MTHDDPQEIARIKARLSDEIAGFDPRRHGTGIVSWNRAILADFQAALIEPELEELTLPGGITDWAFAVTRAKGPYRVFWLLWAERFSLAVESRLGAVDIQVHGDAIGCFSSV